MPKFAVLLAAFNGSSWILPQIESIINQLDTVCDIYVSIDVSSDDTFDKLRLLAERYASIRILPYGDKFGGAARNFFRLIRDVDFTHYDYVCLSDQDDIWLTEKLSHGVGCMRGVGADAFSSDVIAFWDGGRKKIVKKSYPQRKYDFLFEAAGPGCTYIFTASSLQKFKNLLIRNWNDINDISLHDWMLYAFYRSNNYKWIIDSRPLILYRQHQSNQFGVNAGLEAYKKRFLLIKSRWYGCEVKKIASILHIDVPNKWYLIKNFRELRRRPRDAFGLLLVNLIGWF